MSKPITRTMAPATKPLGRDDATPRYGSGSVKRYTDIGTAMYNPRNSNILIIYVVTRNRAIKRKEKLTNEAKENKVVLKKKK